MFQFPCHLVNSFSKSEEKFSTLAVKQSTAEIFQANKDLRFPEHTTIVE